MKTWMLILICHSWGAILWSLLFTKPQSTCVPCYSSSFKIGNWCNIYRWSRKLGLHCKLPPAPFSTPGIRKVSLMCDTNTIQVQGLWTGMSILWCYVEVAKLCWWFCIEEFHEFELSKSYGPNAKCCSYVLLSLPIYFVDVIVDAWKSLAELTTLFLRFF